MNTLAVVCFMMTVVGFGHSATFTWLGFETLASGNLLLATSLTVLFQGSQILSEIIATHRGMRPAHRWIAALIMAVTMATAVMSGWDAMELAFSGSLQQEIKIAVATVDTSEVPELQARRARIEARLDALHDDRADVERKGKNRDGTWKYKSDHRTVTSKIITQNEKLKPIVKRLTAIRAAVFEAGNAKAQGNAMLMVKGGIVVKIAGMVGWDNERVTKWMALVMAMVMEVVILLFMAVGMSIVTTKREVKAKAKAKVVAKAKADAARSPKAVLIKLNKAIKTGKTWKAVHTELDITAHAMGKVRKGAEPLNAKQIGIVVGW